MNIGAESLGHYKKYSDIKEPLVSLENLRKDMKEIEGVEVVISDVIIGRTIFKRMLENLKAQSYRVLQLIKDELGKE